MKNNHAIINELLVCGMPLNKEYGPWHVDSSEFADITNPDGLLIREIRNTYSNGKQPDFEYEYKKAE